MRYFLEIAYKGTAYHGWQSQYNAPSVQAHIEKALSTLLRIPTEIVGSGRTDTGVHAEQQFAHFEIQKSSHDSLDIINLQYRLNGMIPYDIAIKNIHVVHETAHARFDAIERSYEYRICKEKTPFLRGLAYLYKPPVDFQAMNLSASKLLEYNDFQAFTKTGSNNKHFLCTLKKAIWTETEVGYTFHITANRFLYGMVRTLVGTLLEVGAGKLSVEEFEEIIQSKSRQKAKYAAPPEGLFLTKVRYPYLS